ncbi:MAG: aspartate/glutamate racemase family protein [Rhodanobacteraceae bacterium]|nr:aspartate/glutamate racemase family protein [Rhodanobacteraceae bacterium]
MKTIGLIGGMSWESTVSYYRLINEGVKHALGGLHSARLMLYSVDFHDIEGLQRSADWDAAGALLADAARALERGGADCIVLCTNTSPPAPRRGAGRGPSRARPPPPPASVISCTRSHCCWTRAMPACRCSIPRPSMRTRR